MCIKNRDHLYRLIISQLFYDGHSTIASGLAAQVNVDPPCSPSDQLKSVVTKGLQHETDRQKESEQALNLNPIQQMLIGPGIDFEFETNVICTAPEPSLYETIYVTSHKGACRAGAFSSDGQLIATGSSDSSIKILDVERMLAKAHNIDSTGNQEGQRHPVIRTLYDHLEEVTCLEFHPNKPILASGSRDCHVKFFDYSKTSVKKAFNTIDVRCKDSLVKLWELSTGRCLIAYTGAGTIGKQQHCIQALFNHTEEYVMFPDEATTSLCAWNARNASRQQLLSLGHNGPIRSIVHFPNSAAFLTFSDALEPVFGIENT
ncbi:hypothetical protein QTP88_002105 [Uroleucon formosanum]